MNRSHVTGARPSGGVPPAYRALHDYLKARFADTVVLTLTQIEDLIGDRLPAIARTQADWWDDTDAEGRPSSQSGCWTLANRHAHANLRAGTVAFDRVSI